MGKKINVYFNICVLPHKKQFERVPCSFDGFPYLNSFHTSALGVLWGLQSKEANSPSQAKHVVSKSCAKQMLMTTLMIGLPSAATSAGSLLCRLWQTWSSNYSVLQMNSLGIEASAESASTEQKSLLFWYGGVSVGGRRALTSLPLLYPSSLRCHSLYSSSLCLLLSMEVLVLSPSSLTPGWRLYQEIREGSGGSLFTYGTERGVLLVLNQHETNLPKQRRVR